MKSRAVNIFRKISAKFFNFYKNMKFYLNIKYVPFDPASLIKNRILLSSHLQTYYYMGISPWDTLYTTICTVLGRTILYYVIMYRYNSQWFLNFFSLTTYLKKKHYSSLPRFFPPILGEYDHFLNFLSSINHNEIHVTWRVPRGFTRCVKKPQQLRKSTVKTQFRILHGVF